MSWLNSDQLDRLFALACERYRVLLHRQAGLPRPWSDDPLLNEYHINNVFRDDDAVSRFIMRRLLPHNPGNEWVTALVGRLVNNEHSLSQLFPTERRRLRPDWREWLFKVKLNSVAYKINTTYGLHSRDGIVAKIVEAERLVWPSKAEALEDAVRLLLRVVSPFIAYQIALDLKGSVLPAVPADADTWTQPGVGCFRGALRACGLQFGVELDVRHFPSGIPEQHAVIACIGERVRPLKFARLVCSEVLEAFRARWPTEWPVWRLSDAEHMLCEFDRVERLRAGHTAGVRRFRPQHASLFEL